MAAGPGAHAPSAVDVEEGKRHFARAQEHYRARRFREALQELELAHAKVPSPELLFNLARTHEQIGEIERAIARYEEYLAAAPGGADVDAVRARVRELSQRHEQAAAEAARAGLRIDVNRDGAQVALDGTGVGETPLDALLWLEPGVHQLEVTREGDQPFRAELRLSAGSVGVAYADLSPHTSAAVATRDADSAKTPVWVAAGTSAVAALTGGTLAWVAEAERDSGAHASADDLMLAAGTAFTTAIGAAVVAALLHGFAPADDRDAGAAARSTP